MNIFAAVLAVLMQPAVLSPQGKSAVVLLFVRSDCPVSNKYAPKVQSIYNSYHRRQIDFYLVYSELGLTSHAMEDHRREMGYTIPALLDEKHEYVRLAHATITPQVAIFVRGKLVYRGRIDDRYVDIGKEKAHAASHDLEDVLDAALSGGPVPFRETKSIGCAIEPLP